PSTNSLPPELLAQFVNKPKVIYYDWEITEARLSFCIDLYSVLALSANRIHMVNNPGGVKWLRTISTMLGNTGTEAELTAPDEISVLRRSPAGLTGVELFTLVRWLDQTDFPKWSKESVPVLPGVPAAPVAPKN
ncbi:MAG: hypothetical protein K0Q55_3779, partial [Verrucomicrobia bacterium]|nr:hypothetical protein [Verrucomicrobiota bacterium]